jgi:formylglycine-generating enzyme required for sulfatase activity
MKRLMWLLPVAAVAVVPLLLLLPASAAPKGQKYAFLVACGDYTGEFRKLKGTVAEMTDFREALIGSGYKAEDIVFLHDKQTDRRLLSEKRKIEKQLDLLLARLTKEDSLLVALDGHGLQFKGEKASYFLPVDAEFDDKKTMLPLSALFEKVSECKAGAKLMLVNACRNGPLADGFAARRVKIDDKDEEAVPKGVAALFSCQPKQRSFEYPKDSKRGKPGRSLFFHHVIQAWKGEYSAGKPVTVEHLFREVHDRAAKDAADLHASKQVPEVRRKYEGVWVLNEPRIGAITVGKKIITNSIGIKFAYIPPGKFKMGSPGGEKEREFYEVEHEVEITKGFYLGVYEVTQKQYREVMKHNPSYFSKDGEKGKIAGTYSSEPAGGKTKVEGMNTDDFPVDNVSWDDAQEFIKRLNALAKEKKEKRLYRLPSEAEWEWACRGGSAVKTTFHFGNSLSSTQANFNGGYPYGGAEKGKYLDRTCKVGSYKANGFGLYDMHGNVYEWCHDTYDAKFYSISPKRDPVHTAKASGRVVRGGSWADSGRNCRSASRIWYQPTYRLNHFGFRVALVAAR